MKQYLLTLATAVALACGTLPAQAGIPGTRPATGRRDQPGTDRPAGDHPFRGPGGHQGPARGSETDRAGTLPGRCQEAQERAAQTDAQDAGRQPQGQGQGLQEAGQEFPEGPRGEGQAETALVPEQCGGGHTCVPAD